MDRDSTRLLWWGLAPKTRKTYLGPVNLYVTHCALHSIQPAFPATVHSLTSWVGKLGIKRITAKTIKSYLTAVRSAHIDVSDKEPTAFRSSKLQRMVNGSRRMHGEAGTQERLPITKDLLLQMLQRVSQRSREGATLYAAFCLAFAGFLRSGEFTYTSKDRGMANFGKWFLTRRSVTFFDDHIVVHLPSSKTDRFRKGIDIPIAASGDNACPVKALRRLFRWKASPDSPLFERTGGFTREYLVDQVRQILTSLGVKGHYSGHSFRRGAATSAKEAGLTDREIMLLGRWKSDCYRLYIVANREHILAASRRHQQHRPRHRSRQR